MSKKRPPKTATEMLLLRHGIIKPGESFEEVSKRGTVKALTRRDIRVLISRFETAEMDANPRRLASLAMEVSQLMHSADFERMNGRAKSVLEDIHKGARMKAMAIEARLSGNIQAATRFEEVVEELYENLQRRTAGFDDTTAGSHVLKRDGYDPAVYMHPAR